MVGPLTAEQLHGIKIAGIFTVNSRRYAIPYKWKISGWLQKGAEQIQLDLYTGLGKVFDLLYEIKLMVDVRENFQGIWSNIQHIAMLYVGLKSLTVYTDSQKIMYEMEKQRQKETFRNYAGKFSLALVEYLDTPI